jgi:hypothetical protein
MLEPKFIREEKVGYKELERMEAKHRRAEGARTGMTGTTRLRLWWC